MELKNFSQFINETQAKYLATGAKAFFYGTHLVTIKVIESSTAKIVIAKEGQGADLNSAYQEAIKNTQDQMTKEGISGIVLPKLEELDSSQ